jgi:hypothetical protein
MPKPLHTERRSRKIAPALLPHPVPALVKSTFTVQNEADYEKSGNQIRAAVQSLM